MLPSLIFLAVVRAHRVVAYDRKAAAQSHHDILRLDAAYELVRNKSIADFGVGHVLAMMFIPIEFLGVYHLQGILLLHHRSTGEENDAFCQILRSVLVAALFVQYAAGTVMHSTWTFVSLTLNFASNHPASTGLCSCVATQGHSAAVL